MLYSRGLREGRKHTHTNIFIKMKKSMQHLQSSFLQLVIWSKLIFIIPFFNAHSIFSLSSGSSTAYYGSLLRGVTQTFISKGYGISAVFKRLFINSTKPDGFRMVNMERPVNSVRMDSFMYSICYEVCSLRGNNALWKNHDYNQTFHKSLLSTQALHAGQANLYPGEEQLCIP